MGKLLILAKYIFLIYSIDITELRKHVHVTHAVKGHKVSCKFWLEPFVEIDENKKGNFTEIELREIQRLIEENKSILLEQLADFYKGIFIKAKRL